MKKGKINKELKSGITNNDISSNIFKACTALLNEDTELSVELTNETAPPEMSDFEEE